jgi:hypothetical protein
MEYDAGTKENDLSMESPETYGLLGYYRKITPSVVLSDFPLHVTPPNLTKEHYLWKVHINKNVLTHLS